MVSFNFVLPFNPRVTDNNKYINSKFHLNPEYTHFKHMICAQMSRSKLILKKDKVYVSFVVYKPTLRVDCHNYCKVICDGIKLWTARKSLPENLRVDDNMFAVTANWEIDKIKPRIEVSVWQ